MAAFLDKTQVHRIGLIGLFLPGGGKKDTQGNVVGTVDDISGSGSWHTDMEARDARYRPELLQSGDKLKTILRISRPLKPEEYVMDKARHLGHKLGFSKVQLRERYN